MINKDNHQILYRMIEEVVDYAIILMDTNGIIRNWNRGAERIKGYSASEIIGQSFRRFYTESDRKNGKPDRLLNIARKEGRAQDESWRVRKDGTMFWGSITITAIHDDNGEVKGFSKVTRDLTERKKAEEAQREYAHELEIKNKELEQFTYIASHDLQEPLRTVQNFTNLLNHQFQGKLNAEADQYLSFINEAAERMGDLIKGLLEYSRLGFSGEPDIVDCNRVVNNLLIDLNASIQESDVSISVGDLPEIRAYPTEMRLLFQNLISNAIKFRREEVDPEIEVNGISAGNFWKFSVRDNGIGIPEEYRKKIFLIFQRLHPKHEYNGTGIGLAHCSKIVELHGGKIWVESKVGTGSTFFFTIKKSLDEKQTS